MESDSKGRTAEIVTCDKEGKAIFKTDIPVGTELYVKEYSTQEHYQLSDAIYPVTFEYAGCGQEVVKISVNDGKEIENHIKYGTVKGLKVVEKQEKQLQKQFLDCFLKRKKSLMKRQQSV